MQDLEHQPPKQTILRYFAMGVGPPSGSARRFAVTDMSILAAFSIPFSRSTCCLEERFVWEILMYKLSLLLGGAFCVGNSYLQTQLAAFPYFILSTSLFSNLIPRGESVFPVGNPWSEILA